MRRAILILGFILLATFAATKVWAFVSASANVSKENAYAILKPPRAAAVISKQNGYAILKPPAKSVVISKANAYAIVVRQYWSPGYD